MALPGDFRIGGTGGRKRHPVAGERKSGQWGRAGCRWFAALDRRDTPDSIPFVQVDANLILWKRFAPGPHLGHRLLQVRALDRRAHYQLMIDGLAFGSALDVETLRRGINLDDLDTPMHLAARTLNYASADSQLNQVVRTRLIGRHGLETAGKPTFLEGASDLNDAVEASEQAAEKASQPTEHKFRLQRIVMVP
jgi:hypothetical protein